MFKRLKAVITNVRFEHKYAYFDYDAFENDKKIDSYTIQYSFEHQHHLPLSEKLLKRVLNGCLDAYIDKKGHTEEGLKKRFVGLAVEK